MRLDLVKRPICFAAANFCDLFERQDIHFSAWSPLPVHTIISGGATGFAGPAAALSFNVQTDLPAASAAKVTEYMLEPAAASVAALADHVLDTLLLASEALACGYLFCKNDLHSAAAAAAALSGKFLCVPFSKCVTEFELVSSGNLGNWLSGFLLLCCVFWCQRRDPGKVLPSPLGMGKQGFTSEEVKVPCDVF